MLSGAAAALFGRREADAPSRHRIQAGVTLAYRRERADGWPYNLYAMVHGTHRQAVMAVIQRMTLAAGLDGCPREVLFSTRRFKQTGARRFRGWHAADSAAPAPEADHALAR